MNTIFVIIYCGIGLGGPFCKAVPKEFNSLEQCQIVAKKYDNGDQKEDVSYFCEQRALTLSERYLP